MPVVDIDTDELRTLIGHEKSDDELKSDLFDLGLEFEGETDDGDLQFEFAPDRLDRLSVEGVARSLRYQYGDARGVHVPDTNDPDWVIEVEDTVPDERPYVTGAVVRDVSLDEQGLESLIQLQEKLHATIGRDRAKGAIGVHDLTMLQGEQLSGGGGLAEVTAEEGDPTGDDPIEYTPAGEEQIAEDGTVRRGSNSITYRGIAPDGDRFVPLDHESMAAITDAGATPAEVLAHHPTGDRYGDIVREYDRYPAIYDERGLFSFPPVINGQRTEVSTDSRDLLIELTGTDQWTIDRMCTILVYALSARGGRIEEVRVEYADGTHAPDEGRDLLRPDLMTDEKSVSHARIERTLGVELETDRVIDLFERSGLDATYDEEDESYDVEIPPYRVDVLHPSDLVDDVGRAYGFNTLTPRYPNLGTIGGRREDTRLEDAVRASLVGLGFQDTLNFNMTNPSANYDRMRLEHAGTAGEASDADDASDERVVPSDGPLGSEPAVGIRTAYSEEYTQLRTWALPSLMAVLANNTHRAYPQDLAEIGFVAHRDDREPTNVAETRHVAGVLARTDASYEDAKARLAALCDDFGVELSTPPTEHPSFIPGRVASVTIDGESVGVVGELHPAVLVDHDLEVPVVGFEFPLGALG